MSKIHRKPNKMNLLVNTMQFVVLMTKKYKIDESHGLSHSMNVLHFANKILIEQIEIDPTLKNCSHMRIIYISAVLHDMCDKKYIDVAEGIDEINTCLQDAKVSEEEIRIVNQIIDTMSYSKVKENGFPDLGIYMNAYHIVREADLLSAYDFDRCMIYNMYNKPEKGADVHYAFSDALKLFQNRVFKHDEDGLLTTQYAKNMHPQLKRSAEIHIENWRKIMRTL